MALEPFQVDVSPDVQVAPGWTYCSVQKKFFPPGNSSKPEVENLKTEEISIEHPLIKFSQENSIQVQGWLKDQAVEGYPHQVTLVTGKGLSEVKCNNAEHHLYNHVVISVEEKYSVQMVIILSPSADQTVHRKISSLMRVSSNEEVLEEISKMFMKGCIIENDAILNLPSLRKCVEMFWFLLKSSNKVTTRKAYLLPKKPAFGSESVIRKKSDKIPGSMHCSTPPRQYSDENGMDTASGIMKSTIPSGQPMNDTSVIETGKVSSEDRHQARVIGHKDTGDGKRVKEQERRNKKSTCAAMPRQACLDDPLHNIGASAGGAVCDSKHSSKSTLQVKESGDSYDRERGNHLYCEKEVKEESGSQHEKQSVASSIIESCKTVLSSSTADTQVGMSSQENRSDETTDLTSTSGKGQTQYSHSTSQSAASLNENQSTKPEPLHHLETHGDTDRHKYMVREEATSNKRPASGKTRVIPEEASKSSFSFQEQKPLLNQQTTKAGKGRHIQTNVIQPINSRTNAEGILWNYYGNAKSEGKVLLLIGSSKSGKTTLVNFIANYLKGNQEIDEECIVLENTSNNLGLIATNSITAHTLCFSENDPTFTVIDTPGLSDCDGKEREATVQALKALFKNTAVSLHAIGLVVPATLVHLTSSERHMIDDILTHFGETAVNHCIIFITSADFLKTPPAVDVLKSHGVKTKMVLQLNNSVFSHETKDDSHFKFDRIYWKKGMKSLKKCFSYLENISPIAVNTLKVAQLEAYTTTVMETSTKNLKEALMHLTKLLQHSIHLTEETIAACERVWEAGTVVQRVISGTGKMKVGVEITVVAQAQQVASELRFPPDDLVSFLSLSKSRGLLSVGSSVIKGLAPVYTMNNNTNSIHTSVGSNPACQYCTKCGKVHVMDRHVDGVFNFIKGIFYSQFDKKDIVYACPQCKCLGCHHELHKENEPKSLNLNQDWLLQHTKVVINDTLRKLSLPGHQMTTHAFLQYIDEDQKYKFHDFIEELKKTKC